MIDIIKREALKAFFATNPVNILTGTIVSSDPIEVSIHQKLTLTKDFLIKTDIWSRLAVGDDVVVARVQGGNQFVVLDKVVD